jgi:Protein of unknown function (DUF3570)
MKSVPTKKNHGIGAALFVAAMALPSYHSAFAEAIPENGTVAFKYLNYQDSQPNQDRIGVNACSTSIMMPFAAKWSVSTSYTYDSVSGASPRRHDTFDTIAGASQMSEERNAGDLNFTRYLDKGSITFGTSYSEESDYISRGYSLQRSFSTTDNNTTVTLGGSYSTDTINAWKKEVYGRSKKVYAGLLGVSKVLTKKDIVQFNIGFSRGEGYFSDPYKEGEGGTLDPRPKERNITTLLTRWNHHFDSSDGTARVSYRYYTDSYDISVHTLGVEYVQPLPYRLTITPVVRYSSQTAASFYVPKASYNPLADPPKPYSYDERLSAFGALTSGLRLKKKSLRTGLLVSNMRNTSNEQHGA